MSVVLVRESLVVEVESQQSSIWILVNSIVQIGDFVLYGGAWLDTALFPLYVKGPESSSSVNPIDLDACVW